MADLQALAEMGYRPIRITTVEELQSMYERLAAGEGDLFVQCSVCEVYVLTDKRGDVLDSSGRCDPCRP